MAHKIFLFNFFILPFFVAGCCNTLIHFNGASWEIIKERPEDIVLRAGDCSNNMVAATGFTSSGGVVGKAVIIMGTQTK